MTERPDQPEPEVIETATHVEFRLRLEERFPLEWVAFHATSFDQNNHPIAGEIIGHDPNIAKIIKAFEERGKNEIDTFMTHTDFDKYLLPYRAVRYFPNGTPPQN